MNQTSSSVQIPRLFLALACLCTLLLMGYFLRAELLRTGGELGTPLDDSWIHYQFARNLSQGAGFSYNPGEPTPGSTAPLWTVLLAGVGLLFGTQANVLMIASIVLSAGFLLAVVVLTYGFTLDLTAEPLTAVLATLSVAMVGRLIWAGMAGMETTAFAALSLAAVWAYHRQGLRPLPVLLLAFGTQLRPEGHALFALLVADTAWKNWQNNSFNLPALWKTFALPFALYAVVVLPYSLFSLATTGHPLPNTFYAKAGSKYFFSTRTLQETLWWHWQDNRLAFLLIPFGLLPAWRKSRVLTGWVLGLPLLVALMIDQVWHHGRYTQPLIPFQLIVAAMGASWLLQWLKPDLRKVAVVGTAVALCASGLYPMPAWSRIFADNVREIIEIDVHLAYWLRDNTPPDALVAVDDIGAIGFLSERRLFDVNGLISPEIWPVIRGEVEGRPRNEAVTRFLSHIAPNYLALFPQWHWELATNPLVAAPLAEFTVDTKTIIGEQTAVVYRATWPYLNDPAPTAPPIAVLGEAIALDSYDFTPPTADNPTLALTLYWRSLAPVTEGYDVFIHVLNPQDEIVAQADTAPIAMLAPTNRWQSGDRIRDPYSLPWPADLPPGPYRITVGLFLRASGERLPVSQPPTPDNVILLKEFQW